MSGENIGPVELVQHAREVLDGRHALPALQACRAAALLARQALEEIITQLCTSHGADLHGASMRSRLVCLRQLTENPVGDSASLAWGGLSAVCHHHAYQLTPTAGEVAELLDQVAWLAEQQHGRSR